MLENAGDIGNAWMSSRLLFGGYGAIVAIGLLASAHHAVSWRDPMRLLFAVHVALIGLLIAALTGFAGQYLWPAAAAWDSRAPLVISWLALGWTAMLVRELVGELRKRRLSAALLAHAASCLLLALAGWRLDRETFRGMAGYLLVAGLALLLAAVARYAVRRPQVGWRVFAGLGLLLAAALMPLLRGRGWLPDALPTGHGLQLAAALEIPLVLAGLRLRGRERHLARDRLQAFACADPLTGVGNQRVLIAELDALLRRSVHQRSPGAVLRVHVANLGAIRERYGREPAQAAVMHAAECVQREAREHDTVARVQGGDLVLLLEGQATRNQAAAAGRNIIARGLKFSSRLPPGLTLSLQVAAVCAPLPRATAASLLGMLGDELALIAQQRHGTALHFLEPDPARNAPAHKAKPAPQAHRCS